MDPGTIAGITIGAVAGALILGNIGRNLTIRHGRSKRINKARTEAERRMYIGDKNGYMVSEGVAHYSRTKGIFSDPTAKGRRKRKISKKTRKQNKKK